MKNSTKHWDIHGWWLEFHPSRHVSGWNSNCVVGNPTWHNGIENWMLEVFANFQKIIPKRNLACIIPMGLDIWWVSEQPQPLDVIQNWVFVIMWLDFQPQKTTKKYEMCLRGQQNKKSYLKHLQYQGNMDEKDWIRKKYKESYHWEKPLPKTKNCCLMQ